VDLQFDIDRILMNTHNRFLMQPGYEDTRPFQYQIFFQIKDHSDQFYVVKADQDSPARLWKITGKKPEDIFLEGELIKNSDELAVERPNLRQVFIKFNNKIINKYENFDTFWEDVGHL